METHDIRLVILDETDLNENGEINESRVPPYKTRRADLIMVEIDGRGFRIIKDRMGFFEDIIPTNTGPLSL